MREGNSILFGNKLNLKTRPVLQCYWKHFGEIQNMALSKTIQDKRRFPDVNEDDIEGMLKPKFKKNTEKGTLTRIF